MTRFQLNKGLSKDAPIMDFSKMKRVDLNIYCNKYMGGDWSRVKKSDIIRILNKEVRNNKLEKLLN